jgi:hypothetical protein
MKKTLFASFALLFFINLATAQIYIDGKELRQESTQFIEVEFIGVLGSADVRMLVDYGQNIGFIDRRNRLVSDKKGKALIFNSAVHGLNWLYQEGYEVTEVYNRSVGGNNVNTDLVYLVKKIRRAAE